MNRLIIAILAFALAVPAYAGAHHCFGIGCVPYKYGPIHGRTLYHGPMICIAYQQEKPDRVVAYFMRDGKKTHEFVHESGLRDHFCFGSWLFTRDDVKPDAVWLCNGTKSVRFRATEQSELPYLVKHGGTPAGEYACLMGTKACEGRAIYRP